MSDPPFQRKKLLPLLPRLNYKRATNARNKKPQEIMSVQNDHHRRQMSTNYLPTNDMAAAHWPRLALRPIPLIIFHRPAETLHSSAGKVLQPRDVHKLSYVKSEVPNLGQFAIRAAGGRGSGSAHIHWKHVCFFSRQVGLQALASHFVPPHWLQGLSTDLQCCDSLYLRLMK